MPISYARHQFPHVVIQYAVWLYLRFTLSVGDVEELLAQRSIIVNYETVLVWVARFGPLIARLGACAAFGTGRVASGTWKTCS
jgi:transposase-like protein